MGNDVFAGKEGTPGLDKQGVRSRWRTEVAVGVSVPLEGGSTIDSRSVNVPTPAPSQVLLSGLLKVVREGVKPSITIRILESLQPRVCVCVCVFGMELVSALS